MLGTGISSDTCANRVVEDVSPLRLDDENTAAEELLSSKCDKFLISVTDFKLHDIPSLDANDIDSGDAWSREPTVSADLSFQREKKMTL